MDDDEIRPLMCHAGSLRLIMGVGVRELVPWSWNMNAAYDVQRGREEGPAESPERLKDLL